MGSERDNQGNEDAINLDSLPKWLRDLIDCNNESAGRDTGRTRRFASADDENNPDGEKKKSEQRFSELLRRLQDPAYAKLYFETENKLDRYEDAAARALKKITKLAEGAAEYLEDLRKSAGELNGKKVFRAADGRLITEDGEDVTKNAAAVTGLSEDSPTWEQFSRMKEIATDLERRQREIECYQREVLNPARVKFNDPDYSPSEEELRKSAEEWDTEMPSDVRAEVEAQEPAAKVSAAPKSSATDKYIGAADLNAPEMAAHFKAVSAFTVDDDFEGPKVTSAPKNA